MELPPDIQAQILADLPLPDFRATVAVCHLWCRLSADIFSQWLQWRQAPIAVKVALPADPVLISGVGVGGARVVRSGGYVGFSAAGDRLWLQRALPGLNAVSTGWIGLPLNGDSATCQACPLRHWPYDTAVGGLPGGMVAHSRAATAFFPLGASKVEEVHKGYQNILDAGGQVFLLRSNTSADVMDMSTGRKVRCQLRHFFEAIQEQCQTSAVRMAVSATSKHFLVHSSTQDGAKVAASLRLPIVRDCADGVVVTPTVSFARRWPASHPIAMESAPRECPVGDFLVLHGTSCRGPVCLLDAESGNVDVLRLRQIPGVPGNAIFAHTGMNAKRTLFFAMVAVDPRVGYCLAVWHTSGCLLTRLDLSQVGVIPRGLEPVQIAVHPFLPYVAIDFMRHTTDELEAFPSGVDTFLLHFEARAELQATVECCLASQPKGQPALNIWTRSWHAHHWALPGLLGACLLAVFWPARARDFLSGFCWASRFLSGGWAPSK